MARVDSVDRYMCLSVDVQGYGANSDVRQGEIQAELVGLLDAAGSRAGLVRELWIRQPKGDEELSLVPTSEPQQRVVGEFCLALEALLCSQDRDPPAPLRLRLAIDEGPVELAPNGFAGRAVVGVSRLVNCRPLRQALELAGDARLAVIVSQGVYRDWVGSGRSSLRPEWFRCVPVVEKELAEDAWLWVPGTDVHGLALTLATPAPARNPGAGLPWPGAHLAGRQGELARVLAELRPSEDRRTPTVCAISGMAGVGKTSLAMHAARQVAADYPDGCFFVDLHGYTVGSTPDHPVDVLDRLLRRLGVSGDHMPQHVDDRATLFRERLNGRRVLVVLDDAHDVAQVRPLLPGVLGCATLITSRVRLAALDEAVQLPLDVLSQVDSADLFRAVVGPLAGDAATHLVDRIVARCGRLPLAVRIVAARLRSDPSLGLAGLDARLGDEHAWLAELDDGDRSVGASLAVSVADLAPDQQRMFATLGLHPGTECGLHAAAAMADVSQLEARRLLDRLADRSLLSLPAPERYRFHDLVAAFARRYVSLRRTDSDRRVGVHRMVDYYLCVAERADVAITPHRYRIELDVQHRPATVPDVSRPDDAMTWLAMQERTLVEVCQLAVDSCLDVQCWQLSYMLRGYFFLTKRWAPWLGTHETALAATRRLCDQRAEALTLNNLGLAELERGRPGVAVEHYRLALRLFEQVGDEFGEHNTRVNLAWIGFQLGRHDEFLRDLRRAHTFYERSGATRNAAITLRGIALGEIEIGDTGDAIAHLREVEEVFERLGLDVDLAMTLNALGQAFARSPDLAAAKDCHHRALDVSHRCGSAFEAARAHDCMGQLAVHSGEPVEALDHWSQAHAAFRTLGAPQATEVQSRLDSLRH